MGKQWHCPSKFSPTFQDYYVDKLGDFIALCLNIYLQVDEMDTHRFYALRMANLDIQGLQCHRELGSLIIAEGTSGNLLFINARRCTNVYSTDIYDYICIHLHTHICIYNYMHICIYDIFVYMHQRYLHAYIHYSTLR